MARVEFSAADAKANGVEVNTAVDANASSKANTSAANHFKKFFDNDVAMKMDLSGLNQDTLEFHSYNVASNTFVKIDTEYTINKNGYVHFSTPVGGSLAVSDKALTPKK